MKKKHVIAIASTISALAIASTSLITLTSCGSLYNNSNALQFSNQLANKIWNVIKTKYDSTTELLTTQQIDKFEIELGNDIKKQVPEMQKYLTGVQLVNDPFFRDLWNLQLQLQPAPNFKYSTANITTQQEYDLFQASSQAAGNNVQSNKIYTYLFAKKQSDIKLVIDQPKANEITNIVSNLIGTLTNENEISTIKNLIQNRLNPILNNDINNIEINKVLDNSNSSIESFDVVVNLKNSCYYDQINNPDNAINNIFVTNNDTKFTIQNVVSKIVPPTAIPEITEIVIDNNLAAQIKQIVENNFGALDNVNNLETIKQTVISTINSKITTFKNAVKELQVSLSDDYPKNASINIVFADKTKVVLKNVQNTVITYGSVDNSLFIKSKTNIDPTPPQAAATDVQIDAALANQIYNIIQPVVSKLNDPAKLVESQNTIQQSLLNIQTLKDALESVTINLDNSAPKNATVTIKFKLDPITINQIYFTTNSADKTISTIIPTQINLPTPTFSIDKAIADKIYNILRTEVDSWKTQPTEQEITAINTKLTTELNKIVELQNNVVSVATTISTPDSVFDSDLKNANFSIKFKTNVVSVNNTVFTQNKNDKTSLQTSLAFQTAAAKFTINNDTAIKMQEKIQLIANKVTNSNELQALGQELTNELKAIPELTNAVNYASIGLNKTTSPWKLSAKITFKNDVVLNNTIFTIDPNNPKSINLSNPVDTNNNIQFEINNPTCNDMLSIIKSELENLIYVPDDLKALNTTLKDTFNQQVIGVKNSVDRVSVQFNNSFPSVATITVTFPNNVKLIGTGNGFSVNANNPKELLIKYVTNINKPITIDSNIGSRIKAIIDANVNGLLNIDNLPASAAQIQKELLSINEILNSVTDVTMNLNGFVDNRYNIQVQVGFNSPIILQNFADFKLLDNRRSISYNVVSNVKNPVNNSVDNYFIYSDDTKTKIINTTEYTKNLTTGTLVIPSQVTSIADDALFNLNVSEIDMSASQITTLPSAAFTGCVNLKSILLPNTITTMQEYALIDLPSIQYISWPASLGLNEMLKAVKNSPNIYVTKPTGNLTNDFNDYSQQKLVLVPNTVSNIGDTNLQQQDVNNIFANNNYVQSICFQKGNDGNKLSLAPKTFYNLTALKNIVFPSRLTNLYANSVSDLPKLSNLISDDKFANLTLAQDSTFTRLGLVKSLDLSNVKNSFATADANTVFCSYNTYLEEIKLSDNFNAFKSNNFQALPNIKNINRPINANFSQPGANLFLNTPIRVIPKRQQNNVDANTVNSILGTSGLKEAIRFIWVDNGYTEISSNAFSDCLSLITVSLPNSLNTIRSSAFVNLQSLTTIDIPQSTNTIDANAFDNLSSLTQVRFIGQHNNVNQLNSNMFRNCWSLLSYTQIINLPNGLVINGLAGTPADSLPAIRIGGKYEY